MTERLLFDFLNWRKYRIWYVISYRLQSFWLAKANRIKVACVKESLRVGMAVPGRLPRVVPHDLSQPFVVDGQIVPPGVGFPPKPLYQKEDTVLNHPPRPLSQCPPTRCIPVKKYGVQMHAASIQTVG